MRFTSALFYACHLLCVWNFVVNACVWERVSAFHVFIVMFAVEVGQFYCCQFCCLFGLSLSCHNHGAHCTKLHGKGCDKKLRKPVAVEPWVVVVMVSLDAFMLVMPHKSVTASSFWGRQATGNVSHVPSSRLPGPRLPSHGIIAVTVTSGPRFVSTTRVSVNVHQLLVFCINIVLGTKFVCGPTRPDDSKKIQLLLYVNLTDAHPWFVLHRSCYYCHLQ